MSTRTLPEDLSPLNLKAYLSVHFGLCDMRELEEIQRTLVELLEWTNEAIAHPEIRPSGAFCILEGILYNLGLSAYGISIMFPWLTADGKRFLAALRKVPPRDLLEATGVAYNETEF